MLNISTINRFSASGRSTRIQFHTDVPISRDSGVKMYTGTRTRYRIMSGSIYTSPTVKHMYNTSRTLSTLPLICLLWEEQSQKQQHDATSYGVFQQVHCAFALHLSATLQACQGQKALDPAGHYQSWCLVLFLLAAHNISIKTCHDLSVI